MRTLIYTVTLLCALLLMGAASAQVSTEGHFVADEHPDVIAKLTQFDCAKDVPDALVDAGTNWTQLWEALDSLSGTEFSHACWLITNMPHLDRLEMTKDTLVDHVKYAYRTRTDLPYKVPQELFREYILTYRIGDEPVRPWREEIWTTYPQLKGTDMLNTARRINKWVSENLKTRERGFFGPRPDPLAVMAAGTGTSSDIATVAIAMCKTFGVAARQAKVSVLGEEKGGKTWLEVYSDDGRWIPMYPDNPAYFGNTKLIEHEHPHNVTVVSSSSAFKSIQVTPRYSETGTIKLHFMRNGEPADDFEGFSINAWNDGAWLPLDDLGFDLEEAKLSAKEGEGFNAILGDGFYLVQAGVRNGRGDAYVQNFPVTLDAGKTVELTIALDIPASKSDAVDLVQRKIDPIPEFQLDYNTPSGAGVWFPKDLPEGKYSIVVLFDPAAEPSIRMIPSIASWAKNANITLYGVGVGDWIAAGDFWKANAGEDVSATPFFSDPSGTIATALGHAPDKDGKYTNLPLVMMIGPSGKIVYLSEGYNLGVGDGLSRAKELGG